MEDKRTITNIRSTQQFIPRDGVMVSDGFLYGSSMVRRIDEDLANFAPDVPPVASKAGT